MKATPLAILMFVVLSSGIAATPPRIDTIEQLRSFAQHAEVGHPGIVLPSDRAKWADALSERYFNQPCEAQFSGVSVADWKMKWTLMSDALVQRAKALGMDYVGLEKVLAVLNLGRTAETMAEVPSEVVLDFFQDTPAEEVNRKRKEAHEKHEALLKERALHPEKWESQDASIPVAAFRLNTEGIDAWIVLVKWEMDLPGARMGHIRVWCVDSKSYKTLAYVSCD